jgi:hypothetical protein
VSENHNGTKWLSRLGQEFLQAVRLLRRTRTFPLLAIATPAVGLGLSVAMISALDGTLWFPLPFADPERLVHIRRAIPYPTLLE